MMTLIVQSLRSLFFFTLLLGVAYPLLVTGFGQGLFPAQANGSLITVKEQVVASELLAQKITSPRLFHPRPSASDHGTLSSGASNQGATSAALQKVIRERQAQRIQGEMLYASGGGLDPHLSPEAALRQVTRIVESRKLGETEREALIQLVRDFTERRDLGFLGEERVNVMRLNARLIEDYGK